MLSNCFTMLFNQKSSWENLTTRKNITICYEETVVQLWTKPHIPLESAAVRHRCEGALLRVGIRKGAALEQRARGTQEGPRGYHLLPCVRFWSWFLSVLEFVWSGFNFPCIWVIFSEWEFFNVHANKRKNHFAYFTSNDLNTVENLQKENRSSITMLCVFGKSLTRLKLCRERMVVIVMADGTAGARRLTLS